MKKYQLFPFLGLLLFLASCSSTKDMQVLVTKPAIFEMPKNVKKILLVNRSKGNASSVIEGIFTGESPQQDKIQSEQCMAALQESLNLSKTVQVARHNTRLNADKGLSTGFGNPLDWSTVEDLAKEYNADAVLMLEFFDTDFFIRRVNRSNNQYVSVQGTASAVAGFRLYDPMNKTIMYEKNFHVLKTT